MSRAIVTDSAANFERVHGFYMQFLEQCPEALWTKKFGGWPIWQHVIHVYAVIDFFTLQPGQTASPCPIPPEAVRLDPVACTPVNKADTRAYMLVMKAKADAYLAGLNDAALSTKNEGFSARKNETLTHGRTVALLATHAFYHFGTLDAALREEGLKGIH